MVYQINCIQLSEYIWFILVYHSRAANIIKIFPLKKKNLEQYYAPW